VAAPCFDDLRLGEPTKPFEAQTLVAKLAVEAFRDAILPRLAGLDQRCADAFRDNDNKALDTNSGPLSLRRKVRAPRVLTRRDSTSMTSGANALIDVDG
jgi:hypothetical protein